MTDKIKRFLVLTTLVLLIILGGFIFGYYIIGDIEKFRTLPLNFLVTVIIYILIQLVKRYLQKNNTPWYSWLYYIGLVAVFTPLPILGLDDQTVLLTTRIGTLFLFLPPIIELSFLLKKDKKEEAVIEENVVDDPTVEPSFHEDEEETPETNEEL